MRKQKISDIYFQNKKEEVYPDWESFQDIQKKAQSSILFSKKGRIDCFSTPNLFTYFVGENGKNKKNLKKNIDGIIWKKEENWQFSKGKESRIFLRIKERRENWKNNFFDFFSGKIDGFSMVRAWNISVMGAVIFGMFFMTFLYRYFGEGAMADETKETAIVVNEIVQESQANQILPMISDKNESTEKDFVAQIMGEYQEKSGDGDYDLKKKEIEKMVDGYPIEKMAPFIAKQDKIVAAFLVAIAKKESDWGRRVPVLDGEDCFNYWGFRRKRERMGTGEHTCFDGMEDAVETVSKRMKNIVYEEKINTPEEMVEVWKCGYDCSWDNPGAVQKWVDDVNLYFKKLMSAFK